jgi:catechol 2,3-dioxygenase-like lactoylglutathione lyase family enzyme
MRVKQRQIGEMKVRPQPLVAVRDVRASSSWYQTLLAADSLPEHEHRETYDRIFCDGQLILQLHAWDAHDHPNLVNRDAAPAGHGILLWFQVDDFDAAVQRVRSLNAPILEEPHVNPNSRQEEIWIRDPDGYVVVVAGPGGDTGA